MQRSLLLSKKELHSVALLLLQHCSANQKLRKKVRAERRNAGSVCSPLLVFHWLSNFNETSIF